MVRDHQPGKAVFGSILLEEVDWQPPPEGDSFDRRFEP
jgi:hypothetical protein